MDAASTPDKSALHSKWSETIKAYEKRFDDKWLKSCEKIIKRYRDEESAAGGGKFNIFYSNVQTIAPAIYNRAPIPVVGRRNKSKDAVGRVASTVLENSVDQCLDTYDFDYIMEQAVLDWLLTGRGVGWVRYEPHFEDEQVTKANEAGEMITETVKAVGYQEVATDFVPYKDFGHTLARNWDEVTAGWKRTLMSREKLLERFGEDVGNNIPLTHTGDGRKTEKSGDGDQATHALIYEIWDKAKREAIWLSLDYPKELEVKPDPYKLKDFFPFPRPLYGKLPSDSLIPMPDYNQIRHQLKEADDLTKQINNLTDQLRLAGVYDASNASLATLLKSEGNKLIPVKNWSKFTENGGIKGAMDFVPLADVVAALNAATAARAQVKIDIDEITGISDIIRGQSVASETATAQRIKGNFATLRLDDRKAEVARFARDLVRIKAELIAEHYEDGNLIAATDLGTFTQQEQALVPEAIKLLRDEKQRGFRIDIETDSTIAVDEEAERAGRMEFVTAVGTLMEKSMPVVKEAPEIAPLVGEMILFTVRTFKRGRQLEGSFETFVDELKKSAKNAEAMRGQPSPEQQNQQAEIQLKGQEIKLKAEEVKTKQFEAATDRMQVMKPEPIVMQ